MAGAWAGQTLRAACAAIAAPATILAIAALLALGGGLGGLGSLGQVATGPEPAGAGESVRALRPAPEAAAPIVLTPAAASVPSSPAHAPGARAGPRRRVPEAAPPAERGPSVGTPPVPATPAPPTAPAPPSTPAPAGDLVSDAERTARAVSRSLPEPVGAITGDLLDAAIGPEPSAPSRIPLPIASP
jgi:hypothetical protein